MPKDLRDAHKKNDRAVAAAYGFENILDDEPSIVAALFKLYEAAKRIEKILIGANGVRIRELVVNRTLATPARARTSSPILQTTTCYR